VDVIIADFMSEFNMATAAGRRVDQATAGDVAPAYDVSFLEALDPALEDLAKHGIKVAVNAGVTDTKGLYEVVMQMVQKKGLDLKVNTPSLS
jgi:pyruvate/oxaloacetate carboxyltransferase